MKYALVLVILGVVAAQIVLGQQPPGGDHGNPEAPRPKPALHRFRRQIPVPSGGGQMGAGGSIGFSAGGQAGGQAGGEAGGQGAGEAGAGGQVGASGQFGFGGQAGVGGGAGAGGGAGLN